MGGRMLRNCDPADADVDSEEAAATAGPVLARDIDARYDWAVANPTRTIATPFSRAWIHHALALALNATRAWPFSYVRARMSCLIISTVGYVAARVNWAVCAPFSPGKAWPFRAGSRHTVLMDGKKYLRATSSVSARDNV